MIFERGWTRLLVKVSSPLSVDSVPLCGRVRAVGPLSVKVSELPAGAAVLSVVRKLPANEIV